MAPEGTNLSGSIADDIVAIRERWHTKNHPFFQQMARGELPIKALGIYMALHAKYVRLGLQAFGVLYQRGPADVRKMIVENIAEEEGLIAVPGEDNEPHDHMEMIHRFCAASGMTDDEIFNVHMTPAWWARALYYLHVYQEEPIGVILAMASTQEGQMPALNAEVVLPAFAAHYGFERTAPEVEFFAEHEIADEEHSRRQLELCVKYLQTPEDCARALEVSEEMCRLRWACTTETYRLEALGEREILPEGVG